MFAILKIMVIDVFSINSLLCIVKVTPIGRAHSFYPPLPPGKHFSFPKSMRGNFIWREAVWITEWREKMALYIAITEWCLMVSRGVALLKNKFPSLLITPASLLLILITSSQMIHLAMILTLIHANRSPELYFKVICQCISVYWNK